MASTSDSGTRTGWNCLGAEVVHVDRGKRSLPSFAIWYRRSPRWCFLGDARIADARGIPARIALSRARIGGDQCALLVAAGLSDHPGRSRLSRQVQQQRGHRRRRGSSWSSRRRALEEDAVRVLPVVLERFALPGEHRRAARAMAARRDPGGKILHEAQRTCAPSACRFDEHRRLMSCAREPEMRAPSEVDAREFLGIAMRPASRSPRSRSLAPKSASARSATL